jgi:Na+-driven multidrug efflux pump
MKAFLNLIISMWDQFLVFWHALTPAVATIIAATIGASAVAFQIGRQARNAIKLNRHTEALKLKLEVYKDIAKLLTQLAICRLSLASSTPPFR